MEILRCVILEDEIPALDLLKFYCKKISEVDLMGAFNNAVDANDFLRNNAIDLIITDVEMPRLTGLDFIRMLSPRPLVIVITAYPKYAVEGYELDIVDYIVKPVPFERFQKAIEKAQRYLSHTKSKEKPLESTIVYVKEAGVMVKLELEDIIYLEALGDYVKIFMVGRIITTLSTMSKMMENLSSTKFMRVHKSFIINLDKIAIIDSANSLVMLNNKTEITIGRTYKADFLANIRPVN
jgi:DNA-binding LytR/AlgR family response regulator